jgi:hypothetical protein
MQCLVDFIREDLGKLISLNSEIQQGSLETISFEDLYYLYSPGDLLINREGDDPIQLRRLYAVTGGRARLSRSSRSRFERPGDNSYDADHTLSAGIGTWTDVVVDCFFMQWDGTRVSPVSMVHRVNHYTGLRKITDLELYPIRFREKSTEILEAMEARGRRYLDCVGHKKYDGSSVEGLMPGVGQDLLGPNRRPPGYYPYIGIIGQPKMRSNNDCLERLADTPRDIDNDVYIDVKAFARSFHFTVGRLKRARPSRYETKEKIQHQRRRLYRIGDQEADDARSNKFLSDHMYLTMPRKPQELEAVSPDYMKLLPYTVPGYDLRQRDWGKLTTGILHFPDIK